MHFLIILVLGVFVALFVVFFLTHRFNAHQACSGRAVRRTIFLDELKMPKKPDVKPDNEAPTPLRSINVKASADFSWQN